jgi:hypothetical protein
MPKRLYTLNVTVVEGPVTGAFTKANPLLSRTIEIQGDQALDRLHHAIFGAFDRWEQHMYEFQFGRGSHDEEADRYGIRPPFAMAPDPSDGRRSAGDAAETAVDSLGPYVDRSFGYWFDFGDDCYHQIDVVAIEEAVLRRRYPRVIERVGESPPQYADLDEEGE